MTEVVPQHPSPPAIVAGGLVKRFPGVTALASVSLEFPAGHVTAVIGENGAGKSTLMTILAGLQRPDEGTVTINGRQVETFTPHTMLVEHGVALVPQEIALCQDRTVAQNVLLGREGGLIPSPRAMATRTRELLERIDPTIDPRRRVGSLGVAEQQIVLIVRALARECRILILDEPTAALTPAEVERLFALLRRLRDEGTTIIYVSHRMPEVFALTDLVHVLRDGSHVVTYRTDEVDAPTLVRSMVGRDLAERPAPTGRKLGEPRLVVDSLGGHGFARLSLAVRAGEVVGLAGLPDSGRSELVAALFGAARSTGSVAVDGVPLRLRSPADAIRAGIGYVPAERRSQGIFPALSVADNLMVLDIDRMSRLGVIRKRAVARTARERLEHYDVRGGVGATIAQLSGGNQQKAILSRWLAQSPKVLLLDEPTRGVDVGAKAEIHERLLAAAADGTAVVISSSDLPELLRTCDRIVVMAQGRVTGELDAATATENDVMALATGVEAAA